MKPAIMTQLKCVVVSGLVLFAFASQTFAVLRPLFPIKPAAPVGGECIVVGDQLVLGPAKKPLFIIGVSHGSYRLEEALPSPAGALPRLFSTWPPGGFMKDLAVW